MDDGDNPTEEVLYIKQIFEDSLRDNGSYEQIRNHLDKELGIEKKRILLEALLKIYHSEEAMSTFTWPKLATTTAW